MGNIVPLEQRRNVVEVDRSTLTRQERRGLTDLVRDAWKARGAVTR
jgi:hypothetical protein